MIPYGRQNINQKDIDAVVDVLKSDFLTQGPVLPKFEKEISKYCHSQFAFAVNSATSALHIACKAVGLSEGDWLWTSPVTFVASANCGLYCDANVDFVDIDPKTYNLCTQALKVKLEEAKIKNKLPKVIVPVHLSGQSCDMKPIRELADEYNFFVIEDASHAIGGRYADNSVGSCQYSDITVFSFHPVKIITTGEGGVAVTNNPDLAAKLSLLRSHGITRDKNSMQYQVDGPWYYEQLELGYNYRMTDIQAALGLSQLSRLDEFIEKRHTLAACYNELFAELPVTTPYQSDDAYSSYHLYIIRLQLSKIKKDKKTVFSELREAGVGVNLHYIPVYKQPYYRRLGFPNDYCPESEKYYDEAISLPLFPDLKHDEQLFIADQLREILL